MKTNRLHFALLLLGMLLAQGCRQEEMEIPTPSDPDGRVLIVPSATVNGMVSAEEARPGTRGTTRVAGYPYVTTNLEGKRMVIVSADDKGSSGAVLHAPWLQSPAHVETDPANSVSPRFEVAGADSLDHVNYISDNAGCTAPWRRPTIREVELIYSMKGQLETTFADYCYWGSTSKAGNLANAWYQRYYYDGRKETLNLPKATDTNNVRCVRDAYPYITTNATGQMSVIVSQDEYGTSFDPKHAPWTATPVHNELSSLNSVSHRFEFGDRCTQTNTPGAPITRTGEYYWNDAVTTVCDKHFKNADKSDLGTWRLPTEKELEISVAHFNAPANEWYWSATEVSSNPTLAYLFKKGDTSVYANNKTDDCYVRCVRDLTASLPGSGTPGSSTFKVIAYAGATEPTNWATPYFAATTVNATATGFEMSTPQYYPADGAQKLYFYAVAPAGTITGSADKVISSLDINGSHDFMWAKDVRGIAKNSNPALQQQPSFLFQHLLKQVQFKVKADGTFETDKKLTKITVTGTNYRATVNLATGESSFDMPKEIVLDLTATPVTLTTAVQDAGVLMFAPGASFNLDVVVGGVTYPNIPVTLTGGTNPGAAGTANVVTLTFKREQVVATATIGSWQASVDGGTVDVE